MFYCEECRVKRGWPVVKERTYGHCELCSRILYLYDHPTSQLDDFVTTVMDERQGEGMERLILQMEQGR